MPFVLAVTGLFFATLSTGWVLAATGAGVSAATDGLAAAVAGGCAAVVAGGSARGGGFVVSATTGGVMADGFSTGFAGSRLAASIGGFVIAMATRAETGGFFASVTAGRSVLTAEEAAKTTAHAKTGDFQRFGDIRQKAPAFRQELCFCGV